MLLFQRLKAEEILFNAASSKTEIAFAHPKGKKITKRNANTTHYSDPSIKSTFQNFSAETHSRHKHVCSRIVTAVIFSTKKLGIA